MEEKIYRSYIEILKEELVPALGCTEPIAIAYAAAKAAEVLKEPMERKFKSRSIRRKKRQAPLIETEQNPHHRPHWITAMATSTFTAAATSSKM